MTRNNDAISMLSCLHRDLEAVVDLAGRRWKLIGGLQWGKLEAGAQSPWSLEFLGQWKLQKSRCDSSHSADALISFRR